MKEIFIHIKSWKELFVDFKISQLIFWILIIIKVLHLQFDILAIYYKTVEMLIYM